MCMHFGMSVGYEDAVYYGGYEHMTRRGWEEPKRIAGNGAFLSYWTKKWSNPPKMFLVDDAGNQTPFEPTEEDKAAKDWALYDDVMSRQAIPA